MSLAQVVVPEWLYLPAGFCCGTHTGFKIKMLLISANIFHQKHKQNPFAQIKSHFVRYLR